MVIASMGASAVLLFAVPHGQLSQPWPVLAGHVFSAAIGVLCARTFRPLPWLPPARSAHPSVSCTSSSASTLPAEPRRSTAVIGGGGCSDLGYSFIWHPVPINAAVMVTVAVFFNFLFRWRRYPAFWQ